jgi:hypothetical protein
MIEQSLVDIEKAKVDVVEEQRQNLLKNQGRNSICRITDQTT